MISYKNLNFSFYNGAELTSTMFCGTHNTRSLSLISSHYKLSTFICFGKAFENFTNLQFFFKTIYAEDNVDDDNNDMDTSSHRADKLTKVSAMSFISLSG